MPPRQFPFNLLPPNPHNAPASPSPSAATRRRARRNPAGPQPGETFAEYVNRTPSPPPPPAPPAEPSGSVFGYSYEQQRQSDRFWQDWRLRNRSVLVEDGPRERRERSEARALERRSRLRDAFRPSVEAWAGPTSMNLNEIPQARNPLTNRPAPGLGTIRWGADGRRPIDDIMGDTETVAGAPRGLLRHIQRRENPRMVRGDPNSSAAGLFSFIKETWLQWARGALPLYGLPSNMAEEELLWQRASTVMAGAATIESLRHHDHVLRQRLRAAGVSEDLSVADLYLGHFSLDGRGAGGAAALIPDLRRGQTRARAIDYYKPMEYNNPTNRGLFFDANNQPYSPQVFYDIATGARPRADGIRYHTLPRDPVQFGQRLDGSSDPFVVDPSAPPRDGVRYPLIRLRDLEARSAN